MYSTLLTKFNGRDVFDFQDASSWKGPEFAYRVRQEYDDEVSTAARLQTLLVQPGVERLSTLLVGAWPDAQDEGGAAELAAALVAAAPKLPGLRALFFGEMTYDECELSWIAQTDLSPLLSAFPKLALLRVRGGSGLAFSKIRHEGLRELGVETGGLSKNVLHALFRCDFPALERLELLLGEENYGFDGGAEDLQPLLAGRLFPNLSHLGLMNCSIANEVAAVVVNAPLTARLEVLDLSMGNLDDEGFQSLHGLKGQPNLQRLDVSHHYASPAAVEALQKALKGVVVVAADALSPDDEWRPVLHAE